MRARVRPPQFAQDPGDRQRHAIRIFDGREPGIGWHQPVLASGLDAVAGTVHRRHIGSRRILGKVAHRARQLARIGIAGKRGFKSQGPQRLIDAARVRFRIGKRREVFVLRLSDDEGHAPQRLRLGSGCRHATQRMTQAISSGCRKRRVARQMNARHLIGQRDLGDAALMSNRAACIWPR